MVPLKSVKLRSEGMNWKKNVPYPVWDHITMKNLTTEKKKFQMTGSANPWSTLDSTIPSALDAWQNQV